jgi:predicted SAM-dependent methyltransferase
MTKINLGSGPKSANGWINFDFGLLPLLGKINLTKLLATFGFLDAIYVVKWPKIKYRDIRKKFPYKNDSVDYIYCSHVLEHFEKYEAKNILLESRRILGRKGIIRIVLPDLKKIIDKYENAKTFNNEYFGFEKDKFEGLLGNLKKKFIRPHLWMYDFEEIKSLLIEAGFENIKLKRFKEGNCPDIKYLDLVEHEPISLYVEAGGKD